MARIRTLADVTAWRMCLGCGACRYACSERKVRLVNDPAEGIRPVVEPDHCGGDCDCMRVCPVVASDFSSPSAGRTKDNLIREWGPVLEVWEGFACDPEIRFRGSSGGVLTAIGAYCLERLGMAGVLHIGQNPDDPVTNSTFLSRTRADLLERTGSRYAPASVCDRLDWVEAAASPCAVIGRPVEIAALRNAQRLRPQLDSRVGLALSFFCAEAPATRGTLALLDKLGVGSTNLAEVRYRGLGWPGYFFAVPRGESSPSRKVPYREAWAFLQAYRPWSVQLWPDSAGELADISCGDPWYEAPDGKNPGFSLVVVRTERGRQVVHGASQSGYLDLKPAEHWKLEKSQGGLLQKKGSVWGRRVALRLMGLPVTRFKGLDLFHCWQRLSVLDKVKSVFGTMRRVVLRRYYRRRVPTPGEAGEYAKSPGESAIRGSSELANQAPRG
jgi:coenzyme F420 hydrogenase subunit beta